MLSCFPETGRATLRSAVMRSLETYSGAGSYRLVSPQFSSQRGTALPAWFSDEYHAARLPAWLLDIPANRQQSWQAEDTKIAALAVHNFVNKKAASACKFDL